MFSFFKKITICVVVIYVDEVTGETFQKNFSPNDFHFEIPPRLGDKIQLDKIATTAELPIVVSRIIYANAVVLITQVSTKKLFDCYHEP